MKLYHQSARTSSLQDSSRSRRALERHQSWSSRNGVSESVKLLSTLRTVGKLLPLMEITCTAACSRRQTSYVDENRDRVAVLGFLIGGMIALLMFSFVIAGGYAIHACWRWWKRGRPRQRHEPTARQYSLRILLPDRERVFQVLLAGLSSLWGFGTMVEERWRVPQYP